MLKPSECFSGPISDAAEMTVILPRCDYEHKVLIVFSEGKKHAVCLSGEQHYLFLAFECESNDNWAGLHIPGVAIELDEGSLLDLDRHQAPLGSMVRTADKLSVSVNFEGRMPGRGGTLLPIMTDLPPCAERSATCFQKWQIVLGEGDAKRVLASIAAS